MKFSEAIRLGAAMYPTCRGAWVEYSPSGDDAGCLITVALRAAGWRVSYDVVVEAAKGGEARLPILDAMQREWAWVNDALADRLTFCYDHLGCSAQRIADWIEAEERKRGMWDEPVPDSAATARAIVEEALSR